MSHSSRDDGSWSRALLASSGIGVGHHETPHGGSAELHEASGANLAGTRFLELARHRDASVREALARREDCPMGVLASLAHDSRPAVRVAVASNRRANRAVLENLARDRDPAVIKAVARNSSTPLDTLRDLSAHRRQEVRRVADRSLSERTQTPSVEASALGAVPAELREGRAAAGEATATAGPTRRNAPAVYAPRPVARPRPAPGPSAAIGDPGLRLHPEN